MKILSKFSLAGKVAVITGGYGHLGKYMSEGLSEAGAHVVVAGKSRDKFRKTFPDTKDLKISFEKTDISSTVSIKTAFKKITKDHGRIDILVNNAFYSEGDSPESMTDDEWNRGINGALNSVFRCIREIIPHMKKSAGNIINVSSMYGMVSPDFRVYNDYPEFFSPPNYGAAKAGVIQLTRYYAVYLAGYGIRVNCVSPGAFPSPIVQKEKKFTEALSRKIPLGRVGNPEELKGIMVFLASDASSYVTGQNFIVDGGWTVR